MRHKLSVSTLDELSKGEFQPIIGEIDQLKNDQIKRVVLCSGKVYFDLLEHRREKKINDAAIIRIEQLYPFHRDGLTNELKKYSKATEVVWCQEEPLNQGAWYQIQHQLRQCLQSVNKQTQTLFYAGREASASPAAGYASVHNQQQQALVEAAFAPLTNDNPYQVN